MTRPQTAKPRSGTRRKRALRIFVNYRREDSSAYAGRLYDDLAERFGVGEIFIDIDKIEPGLDFGESIERALDSCDVVLAVIGKHWLTLADAEGRRRLDNPDDYVRLELEAALARGTRLIPVRVQGTDMPSSTDLPESLRPLARRHAVELSDTRWRYDVDSLAAVLERVAAENADREREEHQRIAEEEAERERIAAEAEQQRAVREEAEREQAAQEQAERERIAAEVARERAAQEQAERERIAAEVERERAAQEQAERERIAAEVELERAAQEQAERERIAAEVARERAAEEQAEAERAAREQAERERAAEEQAEVDRAAREQAERDRIAEQAERDRIAEEAERERIAADAARARAAQEQAEVDRGAQEQAERERAAREEAEQRLAAEAERERRERDRIAKEKAARERLAATEQARVADQKAERQRAARPAGVERGSRRLVAFGAAAILVLGVGAIAAFALLGGREDSSVTPTQPPRITSLPTITGTSRAGSTLTAGRGSWSGSSTTFAYQWRRCGDGGGCVAVGGATSRTYRLTTRDVGRHIRVAITASNADGSRTAVSKPTGTIATAITPPSNAAPPAVSGTTQEGSSLVVKTAKWQGTKPISVTHEWQRCNASGGGCSAIAGARGESYALGSQDVGHTIRVVERASNRAGEKAVRSSATPVVRAEPGPTPGPTPRPDPCPPYGDC